MVGRVEMCGGPLVAFEASELEAMQACDALRCSVLSEFPETAASLWAPHNRKCKGCDLRTKLMLERAAKHDCMFCVLA